MTKPISRDEAKELFEKMFKHAYFFGRSSKKMKPLYIGKFLDKIYNSNLIS